VASSERLQADNLGNGPGYLLYRLIDKLVDNCFPLVYKIERNVGEVEAKIFESKTRETVFELSVIRRDIIAFRRIIKPQIPVISRLEYLKSRIINEDLEIYFSDISDHLGKIWDSLEDLKTITESLNDTHTSLTSYQTSEVMKVLTTISVIMLPLTLVSGIYGMNIDLPFAHHRHAFAFVMGAMATVAAGMLAVFRLQRWI
jgi:magnesium transporter